MRLRRVSVLLLSTALGAAALTGSTGASVAAGDEPCLTQEIISDQGWAARSKNPHVKDPNELSTDTAKAWGKVPDFPQLGDGSVTIDTYVHMLGADEFTKREASRWTRLINNQMQVLNASFAGTTAGDAAATPFTFSLKEVTWNVNEAWASVTPGTSTELEMKEQLRRGDRTALNIYAGNIGGGLLGWAYFPQDTRNRNRAALDGVVILDESMPGGATTWYSEGDTATHEVGHWLGLFHTFQNGCSASNDFVADTPQEATPQFFCEDRDSCRAPGADPIHNFMDYTEDYCMDHFTLGQSAQMNDVWQAYRTAG
jgi:hypothetical protein